VTVGVLPTGVLTAGTVTDGTVTEGTVTDGTVTDGTVTTGVVTEGTLKVGVEMVGSSLAPLDSVTAHRTPSKSTLKRVPVVAIRRAMPSGTSSVGKTCANPHRNRRRSRPTSLQRTSPASCLRAARLAYLHSQLV
jgi:hypothetical protein